VNDKKLKDRMVVAIDGPAGSGKSTLAKKVATAIDGVVIDTGAMYRCVTAFCLEQGVDPADEAGVTAVANSISIQFLHPATEGDPQQVIANGVDLTRRIREAEVNGAVSIVAAHPPVRNRMVGIQREMGKQGRVVMEGRDIGTAVFPDATWKFFLIADEAERGRRRHAEEVAAGKTSDLSAVTASMANRDKLDTNRAAAPLLKPSDAIEIDTTQLSVDEVLEKMLQTMFS
jgi:cytidylate kinase